MNRSKSEILKYLSDTNTRSLAYHNHKETSAWAALLLFYVVIPQFIKAMHGILTH